MRLLALLAAGLFAGSLIAADDKKKDEEAILGTWAIVKLDTGPATGVLSGDEAPKLKMTFKKDGKMAIAQEGEKAKESSYKLDPAAKVKAIDFTAEGGDVSLGVYTLDGDTLTVTTAPKGDKTRPSEMKADGKGVIVITLTRVKDEKKDK